MRKVDNPGQVLAYGAAVCAARTMKLEKPADIDKLPKAPEEDVQEAVSQDDKDEDSEFKPEELLLGGHDRNALNPPHLSGLATGGNKIPKDAKPTIGSQSEFDLLGTADLRVP